jgi:hypothetical protein
VILSLLVTHLSCGGTTGGDLLKLPFQAGGLPRNAPAVNQCPDSIEECRAAETPLVITNPLGWTITLTKARAALGPFYFNVAPPPTQGFRDGTVIMEVLAQGVVDPLDPTPVAIPVGSSMATGADGFTQKAVTVEIDLFPPDSTQCSCNTTLLTNYSGEGSQAFVEGTATKGNATVPFAGWITLDASLTSTTEPLPYLQRIAGASVNLNFTSDRQSLSLQVDPTHWFDQTDFSVFPSIAPDAGEADAGELDAGSSDAGTPDAGEADAGELDGGSSDAGTPAGAPDGGALDTAQYSLVGGRYTWTNHSTFHSQLLQGFEGTTGVYTFTLSGP